MTIDSRGWQDHWVFAVEVCESRRIVLVTFRGEVTEADFIDLDARGREAQGGPAST